VPPTLLQAGFVEYPLQRVLFQEGRMKSIITIRSGEALSMYPKVSIPGIEIHTATPKRGLLLAIIALVSLLHAGNCLLAQNDFTLVSPKGTTVSLESVRSSNSGLVIVVGEGGVILRSTDAGVKWQRVSSGTTRWLYGVAVTQTGKCIAVGEAGTVLLSSDGGITWKLRSIGASPTLLGADWAEEGAAIIAGQSGMMFKTTDGGSGWQPLQSGTDQQLEVVQFVSPTIAYAAGGNYVLKSTDAGVSWHSTKVSTTEYPCIQSMHFSDASTGVVGDCFGQCWLTTDAGQTWSIRLRTLSVTGLYNFGPDTILETGQGGIRRSTDGGASVSTVVNVGNQWMLDLSFSDATLGFAVGRQGRVLRTTDTGNTWEDVSYDFTASFTDLSYWSDVQGIAVGNDVSIYLTSDAGYSWMKRPAPGQFLHIWMVDSTAGYASDSGDPSWGTSDAGDRIWGTEDGGATWSVKYTCPWGYTIDCIGFWNRQAGCVVGHYYYALGNYGRFYWYTTDGGQSWGGTSVVSGCHCTTPVRSLFLEDSLVGFSTPLGENGLSSVMKTTDGGKSWFEVCGARLSPISGITFADQSSGFAVGEAGHILHSSNGGVTWTEQSSPVRDNLNSVAFASDTLGIAVGTNGVIVMTDDSGTTWHKGPQLTTSSLNKIVIDRSGHFTIVGDDATIIVGQISSAASPIDTLAVPDAVPQEVELYDNYPNPFNPSTTIQYALPEATHVTLRVYDALGRQVRTLVNRFEAAGTHRLRFDGSALSSGIYLYRLEAAGTSRTRKMCLIR
jgi:photosystem II stability/assembly factor-like uncharacterized protein